MDAGHDEREGVMSENGSNLGLLAEALSKAQAAFPKVVKDRTAKVPLKSGGEYSYRYADLASLIDAVRKPLADNGLAFTQLTDVTPEGHVVLVSELIHTSGATRTGRYPLASHDRPQEMGSEITYARRYTLSALLGVASEDDDDGTAAQTGQPRQRKVSAPAADVTVPEPSGALRIAAVHTAKGTSPKTGKAWTRFDVEFSDGRKASTFDLALAGRAEKMCDAKVAVTPTIETNGRNTNLVGLESDGDIPHDVAADPPFEYEGVALGVSPLATAGRRVETVSAPVLDDDEPEPNEKKRLAYVAAIKRAMNKHGFTTAERLDLPQDFIDGQRGEDADL
ncbi:MAG TPA: ERF family protein, partial [Terriglobales bacterium]|nr:ERF family protein [Terriglobales bacterium]